MFFFLAWKTILHNTQYFVQYFLRVHLKHFLEMKPWPFCYIYITSTTKIIVNSQSTVSYTVYTATHFIAWLSYAILSPLFPMLYNNQRYCNSCDPGKHKGAWEWIHYQNICMCIATEFYSKEGYNWMSGWHIWLLIICLQVWFPAL